VVPDIITFEIMALPYEGVFSFGLNSLQDSKANDTLLDPSYNENVRVLFNSSVVSSIKLHQYIRSTYRQ
jgi:hypothetical protein